MRWINKHNKKFKKKAHHIIVSFLKRGWNKERGKYINADYNSFKREGLISKLLLNEQGYHCCYCMRLLPLKGKMTIEHVLPRMTKPTESNKICHYMNVDRSMKKYVKCIQETPKKRLKVPPYPHYIAYENLVASCDGSIWDMNKPDVEIGKLHNCCNNMRGDEDINPLFFYSQVERLLIYERDGELTYNEEKYKDTICAINLEHSTLKLIRKAWSKISKIYDIDAIKKGINTKAIREEVLDSLDLEPGESDFLKRENIWNLLYEYRWFYDYFKYKRSKLKPFLY